MTTTPRLSRTELDAILASCGLPTSQITSVTELTEGTFNTAYRIRRTTGPGLVLKIAPPADTPMLSYERDLMHAEVEFYRAAAPLGTIPNLLHADFTHTITDADLLLMTEVPGRSWHSLRADLTPADRARLRHDLGRQVAALHRITGPAFGYRRAPGTPLASSWPEAVGAMFRILFADADRFAVTLPMSIDALTELVAAQEDLLTGITTPVVVHFDLWPGNILLDSATGQLEIGGLIDGERAFWGDPVAEFASLALLGDIESDAAFLAGYRDAGGQIEFDATTRRRLALYQTYLYLIMLVESAPRGYDAAALSWLDTNVAPPLHAALAVLTAR